MPNARDGRIHFVAGQLTAFAGFGALRNLDLQLVSIDKVMSRDTETRRGDLLDGAATRIAIRQRSKRASSFPPSPVFERPPMRFIAMARVSCASALMDQTTWRPLRNA